MIWPNIGYEIFYSSSKVDSVLFWYGKPMAAVPVPKNILGLKPIAKFQKEMWNVHKWGTRKRRFEDAMEKLKVIGIFDLPDQKTLPYDGVEVSDGWWIRVAFEESGKSKEIAYHCPNAHKRKEDQIIARAWDILKEADPSLLNPE